MITVEVLFNITEATSLWAVDESMNMSNTVLEKEKKEWLCLKFGTLILIIWILQRLVQWKQDFFKNLVWHFSWITQPKHK